MKHSLYRSIAHIKKAVGKLRGAQLLIAASMAANVMNFLYNAYLGRKVEFSEFGLISIIGSFLSVTQIPLSSYSRTIVHKSALLLGKYKMPAAWYWRFMRAKAFIPSLLLTLLWVGATPFLAQYFHTDRLFPFLVFTPVWSVGVAAAIDSGFLSGSLLFRAVAIMTFIEAIVKLFAAVVLVESGLGEYVYLSLPFSIVASFLVGWLFARKVPGSRIPKNIAHAAHFPKQFFASTMLTKLSSIAILTMDILLVKHYLPAQEAGEYAILSLVGKMIYFLASLFTQFIVPFVSRDEGAGKIPQKTFHRIMAATIGAVCIGWVGLGLFGEITVPLLLGEKSRVIVPYVLWYTLALGCFSIGSAIVSYYQSRHRYQFSLISLFTAFGVLGGIFFFHRNIGDISVVMSINAVLFLLVTLLFHQYDHIITPIFRNVEDFLRLFTDRYEENPGKKHFSILIVNWRDTRHVWAGGAENYIQELAKRWVRRGHRVTVFCGNDQKSPRNEVIDGVQMVRRGGFYTVYIWAFLYYILRFRGNFDAVIDCENGIPFFTPLYVRVPTFLIIHHVHQEVLRKHLMFPFSRIAMMLESHLMPFVYASIPVITVSDSSKKDIVRMSLFEEEAIHVVSPGIDRKQFRKNKKTAFPSIVYLGRLRHYKHIDVAIRAFHLLTKKFPNARMTIAGEGSNKRHLERLVLDLELNRQVFFSGKVSEGEKGKLLGKSWVMVQPSLIEGWGITVIEANACGTPVVASNVNGLKDSVQDNKTGVLFEPKNHLDMAQKLDALLSSDTYRQKLSNEAYRWAQLFEWEECAEKFLHIIFSSRHIQRGGSLSGSGLYLSKSKV